MRFRLLDRDGEELVHQQSLKSLSEIGVLIRSESVLKLMEESGAHVDPRKGIARIPEHMVEEALRKAPRSFRLCAREPRNDIELPVDTIPKISTDGLTVYMRDLETGEKRDGTRKDLADFAKLADALDSISFFWPMVTASDVPAPTHTTHELWTALQACTLHVEGDCLSALDARKHIELASLIVGGEDELRRRPIFSHVMCPIAPLSFEKCAVEAQVELARAGIPIVAMSMSLSGMSSPVTMAGTIVNLNTENLASLVITQFASPGAPHIYSSESAPIDMSTGSMNYGSPEVPIISTAAAQMAKRYGRPCMVGGWGTAGKEPGMAISFTELCCDALTMLSGTDIAPGMGGLDGAKGCALEQVVIDAFLWEDFVSFLRDFRLDEEAVALDVVREVGHGNSFLTHPHTAKNFRKELFFFNRERREWWATLSTGMVSEAREVARRLLREHEVPPLDRDIAQEGERIIQEYEKSLVG